MEKEEKMIICSRCGAEIKESQAYCNYCGCVNILGAEVDYFNKLEGVRKDLEELGDDSKEEFKKTIKSSGKLIAIALIIAAAIVALIIGIIAWRKNNEKKHYSYSYNEKMQVFAQLNEYYEAENYDEIVKFYEENSQDNYQIFEWEHNDFYGLYTYHSWFVRDLKWYEDDLQKSNKDHISESRSWMLYDAIQLRYYYERDTKNDSMIYDFTEDEAERMLKLLEEDEKTVIEKLHLEKEELDRILKDYSNALDAEDYWGIEEFRNYLKENNLYEYRGR